MNRRQLIVISAAAAAVVTLGAGSVFYDRSGAGAGAASGDTENLVRPHSPVFGPSEAPVTIVEFFDPSCEACRAFYPFVKNILAQYPDDVRLVLRYAAFHGGSDQAIGTLEAAPGR